MNGFDDEGLKRLLQEALPPIEGDPEPARDLWPAVLRRMNERPRAWLDLALLGGLVGLAAMFPAAIPVVLYYM